MVGLAETSLLPTANLSPTACDVPCVINNASERSDNLIYDGKLIPSASSVEVQLKTRTGSQNAADPCL